jgi:hypothetical protein
LCAISKIADEDEIAKLKGIEQFIALIKSYIFYFKAFNYLHFNGIYDVYKSFPIFCIFPNLKIRTDKNALQQTIKYLSQQKQWF